MAVLNTAENISVPKRSVLGTHYFVVTGAATKLLLGDRLFADFRQLMLVVWHSGRTSVFSWQTFPVLHSTCI